MFIFFLYCTSIINHEVSLAYGDRGIEKIRELLLNENLNEEDKIQVCDPYI